MTSEEPRPHVHRQYEGDGIIVHWEPAFCLHTGNCTLNQPAVFNPKARPWVNAGLASADAIADAIRHCPSGALSYERTDGAPQEPVADEVEVEAQANGPLYIRGNLEIRDAEGKVIRRATRAALCRCGSSRNKPFCDNTHILVGFEG